MAGDRRLFPLLKAAIAEAKSAGLGAAATELEERAFAAYTTSSELMGEHQMAISEFLEAEGPAIPPHIREKLEQCLEEIRKGSR